jgi:hypothetical protein
MRCPIFEDRDTSPTVEESFYKGVKLPDPEDDHSTASIAEVKNYGAIPTLLLALRFVVDSNLYPSVNLPCRIPET